MRKVAIGIVAAAAMIATPLHAADMPVKAPPLPAPVSSWTGFYIGLNGGYGWGHNPVTFSPGNGDAALFFPSGAIPGSVTTDPRGGLFGGQIGYNYQWSNFVAGVETDFDWTSIRGNGAVTPVAPPFSPFTVSAQQKLESLGTFRGRFGVVADHVLIYATGGLAYGSTLLNTSLITSVIGCGPNGVCASASSTQWQIGWSAGAGAEWAFGSGWNARIEYLHYDLGTHNQSQFDPLDLPPTPIFNSAATFSGNIVRAGIIYRFGG
jgi:outer membrane immunogenic protein